MERENRRGSMMSDGPDRTGEPGPMLSPGDYLDIAKRRKWSFILPFLFLAAVAAATAFLLPPKYRSSATILIEEQEIPTDFVTATVTSFAEQRLQQINQRIMSTTKLLEIIEAFDLYRKMRDRRTTEEVIEQMREDVKLKQISTEVMDRRTGRPTVATIAFSLSYQGKDSPKAVQRVASKLVSLFLQENLEVRERQTAETSQFLQDETRRIKTELSEIELALSEFKEKHIKELPDLLQVNIQGLSNCERSTERLEEQLRSIKEREGYLQVQLANLSPFMENSDRTRLAALETELVTLKTRFSDDHPDVTKAKAEISALKSKMASDSTSRHSHADEPDNPAYVTLAAQLASAQSEIRSIRNQIGEFRKTKAIYEVRIENTPRVERQYKELSGRQMNLQAKYNDLMQKHMEAKVAIGLEKGQKGERFTLIDPPRLPEKPFKPNRLAIMLIGIVLGIGAGVGWAALRELTDQSIRSSESEKLAVSTGFTVLGKVPNILTKKDRRRILIRRRASVSAFVVVVAATFAVFHLFVMDLNVLWAKVGRKVMLP
jgi:polysaccharide chain length determinant protein (PEP-CTERM system associated)